MAREPSERHQGMDELLEELQGLFERDPEAALPGPEGAADDWGQFVRSNSIVLLLLAALLFVLGLWAGRLFDPVREYSP